MDGFVTLLDLEAPVWLDCPGTEITVPTLPGTNYTVGKWSSPAAVDNRGVTSVTRSIVPEDCLLLGLPTDAAITVTHVARDLFDNEATCTFPLRVVDLEPPKLQMPDAFTVNLDASPRTVRQTISAVAVQPMTTSDNSGRSVRIVSPIADFSLAVGGHNVDVVVADAWGNEALGTVAVTVRDETPPTLTCPPSRSAFTLDDTAEVSWGPVVAVDNDLDEPRRNVMVSTTPVSGSQFPLGITVVRVRAADMSGNLATCTFNVTVSGPSVRVEQARANEDNTGTILGGAVGGGVALLAMLLLLLYAWRARRMARNPQDWSEIFARVSENVSRVE
jgi:hypothetical protein